MTEVWKIIAAVQRTKEMSTHGESKYKRKLHFLKNPKRKEHVNTPKIDE